MSTHLIQKKVSEVQDMPSKQNFIPEKAQRGKSIPSKRNAVQRKTQKDQNVLLKLNIVQEKTHRNQSTLLKRNAVQRKTQEGQSLASNFIHRNESEVQGISSTLNTVQGKVQREQNVPSKRNTIQKNLILQALYTLNHPCAENVYDYVSLQHPSISKATVYRNLKEMATQGEILMIDVPAQASHFDHTTYSHYHFHCKKCGDIFDITVPNLMDLSSIKSASGFEIDNHMLLFTGTCPKCHN